MKDHDWDVTYIHVRHGYTISIRIIAKDEEEAVSASTCELQSYGVDLTHFSDVMVRQC